MKKRKRLLAFLLTLVMVVTALMPNGLVFANDTVKETDGFYYTLDYVLSKDKTEETVTLTLQAKEAVTIQEIILPNGETIAYTEQPVSYTVFENSEGCFKVNYVKPESSVQEQADTTTENVTGESSTESQTEKVTIENKIVEIPIEIKEIETPTLDDGLSLEKDGLIRTFDLQSVVRKNTGTLPFDDNDNAGNDSNANNAIIRSFDSAQYDMTYSGEISTNVSSVDIDFELTLNVSKKYAEFNTEILSSWMTDISQTDIDGKCVLTGKTTYNYTGSGTGGFQTFSETKVVEVDVKGMNQFEEVIPTFKVKLKDEATWKEKVMSADTEKLIVSATPMYDIELVNANNLGNLGTFDFSSGNADAPNKDAGNVYGRLMDFGVAIRLKAFDSDKGMKGFYIPEKTDNLSFKLNTTISENGKPSSLQALLWDYKENNRRKTAENGRDMGEWLY